MTSRKRNHKSATRILIILFIKFVFACLFLFLFSFLLIYIGLFGPVPDETELKKIRNYTASEVYSSDHLLLGRYYVENRTNTALDEIPGFLINALIATEDVRFFKHRGMDTRSTFRVIIKSVILMNKKSGGGSTLTQQLAKNLFPRKNLGVFTLPVAKTREIIIARRLETIYSKDELLELYLNTVPFGDNTYGIETAALVYFNKKTRDLLPQESAVLVGMLKGTTDYNPRINYDLALKRRNVIFNQMVRYEYLTRQKADMLKNTPIKLNYRKIIHDEGPAPYFREFLRLFLKEWSDKYPKADGSKYNIYTDGLKIYTTIDSHMQDYAEKSIRRHLMSLQKTLNSQWKGEEPWKKHPSYVNHEIENSQRYKELIKKHDRNAVIEIMKEPVNTKIFTWEGEKDKKISPYDSILHHFSFLQAGFLSVESKTGSVKAWVGGINYKYFKFDHVTSHRQAGSTFKPVVYAAALEKGISPCDFYANDSIGYEQYDNWVPRNFDGNYGGYYSVKGAMIHSVNTVSVKLLMETGMEEVIRLAGKMGMEGNLPEVPSLALGTAEISLIELIKIYSTFINNGHVIIPVFIDRIEDQEGNIIYRGKPAMNDEAVIKEETAEKITAMLCDVVNNGTAASLRNAYNITGEIAGKTGTTQDHTDGWFVGYTPDLITAVWVGGNNPIVRFNNSQYGQGAKMALPVFAGYMKKLYDDPLFSSMKNSAFQLPDEITKSLDCEEYREYKYDSLKEYLEKKQESVGDFIKRIFKKKKKDVDESAD